MVILVVFNSFNVVKNLKKPDPVAREMPPLYTTYVLLINHNMYQKNTGNLTLDDFVFIRILILMFQLLC